MVIYYRVIRMYGNSGIRDIEVRSLAKARAVAKKWCAGAHRDRAAVISTSAFIGPKKPGLLETYVSDTGGSGRAVCTRRYNAKTGRSTVL